MSRAPWVMSLYILLISGCGSGGDNGGEKSIVLGSVMVDDIDEESRLELLGARMAIEEINQAGVFNRPVRLVSLTASQGDAPSGEKAAEAVARLHDQEGALGFISNFGSEQCAPMIAITNTEPYQNIIQCNFQAVDGGFNMPFMSGGDANDTFYRTVVTTQLHLDVGALVIVESGLTKIGLIRFDDNFGEEVSLGVRLKIGELSSEGLTLAFDRVVPDGPFDLEAHKALLDEVIGYSTSGEVDVTVLAVFQAQAPSIIKYLTENGYTGWLFLTVGSKTFDLFEIATGIGAWQQADSRNRIIGVENDNLQGGNSQLFIDNFGAYTTEELAAHTSTAYDCTYALALALLYADSPDPVPADVKEGIRNFKESNRTADEVEIGLGSTEFARAAEVIASGGRIDFQGASGRLEFDDYGDRPRQGMAAFGPNDSGTAWEIKRRYDEDLNPID